MEIHGISNVAGASSIRGIQRVDGPTAPQISESVQATDQLDISAEAEMISRVHETGDVRADRIEAIRQQIQAGTYDTDEKMEIALGRMFDHLAG